MTDTLLLTDDWTGTTNAAWSNTKWGTNAQSGSGISIQSNKGAIIMPNTGNVRSLGWALTQNSLTGEVLVTFNKGANSRDSLIYISPAGDYAGNAALGSTHPAITNGVYVVIPSNSAASGAAYLLSVAAGTVTTGPTVPVAINLGTDYKCRIRRAGNYLAVKIWSGTTEPAAWSQTWTPATGVFPTSSTDQRAMMMVRTNTTPGGTQTVLFDDLTSKIADDNASYTAQLTTASANSVDPTYSGSANYAAQVSSASALARDPAVSTVRNPNYAAQVSTATATAVEPVVVAVKNNNYTAQVSTASATTVEPTFSQSVYRLPTDDYYFQLSNGQIGDTATLVADANDDAVILFSQVPGNVLVSSATLSLMSVGANNDPIKIYPILAQVSGRPTTKGAFTLGTPVMRTFAQSVSRTVMNVAPLMNQGTVYGFFIELASGSGAVFRSVDSSGNEPQFSMTYRNETVTAGYTAQVATASAVAGNSTVSISAAATASPVTASGMATQAVASGSAVAAQNGPSTASAKAGEASAGVTITVAAEAATATAMAVAPVVMGTRNVSYPAQAATASADAGQGSNFTIENNYNAGVATANARALDATGATEKSANVDAQSVSARAKFIKPTSVNGAALIVSDLDDPYYNRVVSLSPKHYYRLNDASASTGVNRATGNAGITYSNVTLGQFDGPDGRASVHFNSGAFIEQIEASQDETGVGSAFALEFTFRTTKADTFLMAGSDNSGSSAGAGSPTGARELYLRNGRINLRAFGLNGNPNTINNEFTGFTNLADGNWHHVVIRSGVSGSGFSAGETGTEVWVDGKFEIRRLNNFGFVGFPDYIGSRPSTIDSANLGALPTSLNFVGDMTELVFYQGTNLTYDSITRNYYAVMGFTPINTEGVTASAKAIGAVGKGNQKRALYLYFTGLDEVFGGVPGGPADATGQDSISFDPDPSIQNDSTNSSGIGTNLAETTSDLLGYKVFSKSVTKDKNTNGPYRDKYTDDQSLLDLTNDVDLKNYDVIMFKDFPDEAYEIARYEDFYPGGLSKFVEQVKEANRGGIGLHITNPTLAVKLGIVDRVAFVPSLKEQKFSNAQGINAIGYFDYASATEFPWNIQESDGLSGGQFATGVGVSANRTESYLTNKAYYYLDTNRNNRFRVRAVVEGLTDIGSYMIDKAVWHVDYDAFGWQGLAMKYLDRRNGLALGDEFIYNGAEIVGANFLDSVEKRYNRFAGTFATPPGAVKVGTIVTTFGAELKVEKGSITNPYRDYATTIAIESGELLDGKPTGGRIFVDFSDQPDQGNGLVRQVLPNGSNGVTWPRNYGGSNGAQGLGETDEQKTWDYSWTRTTLSTDGQATSTTSATITLANGQTANVLLGSGSSPNLSMVRSKQLFPIEGLPYYTMSTRGLIWLGAYKPLAPGEVKFKAVASTASADAAPATAKAQRSVNIIATPALAKATVKSVYDADVNVLALPATATALATGLQGGYKAEVATATATVVEPENVTASGEQIVMILRGSPITLYLKEET